MTLTARIYRANAAKERAAASEQCLVNRQEMHERSALVWDEMAQRLESAALWITKAKFYVVLVTKGPRLRRQTCGALVYSTWNLHLDHGVHLDHGLARPISRQTQEGMSPYVCGSGWHEGYMPALGRPPDADNTDMLPTESLQKA